MIICYYPASRATNTALYTSLGLDCQQPKPIEGMVLPLFLIESQYMREKNWITINNAYNVNVAPEIMLIFVNCYREKRDDSVIYFIFLKNCRRSIKRQDKLK